MAADDVWILGIHMTKFGKHPDKDIVDLAAEAALGALADAGVTMKDMGVLAAGNLMGAGGGIGQQLQKQIGQTGIPVYNVANACATGATALRTAIMAIKAGEADMGLAVGVEKLAGAGLLGRRSRPGRRRRLDARGSLRRGGRRSTGASAPRPCRACSPRSAWSTATSYGGASFELFAQIAREEPRPLDAQPAGRLQEAVHASSEIMNDVMIAYPNTRPMCSANCDGAAAAVRGQRARSCKTLSPEQQRRAVKVSASVLTTDPWEEACQVLPNVNTLTRNAGRAGLRAGRRRPRGPRPGRAARLLRHRRAGALRQPDAVRAEGGAVDFFESGATWRDGTTPVNVSGGLESKGHPIAATGIANIWEVCHHLRGEAGDRQIEGAKVGLAHVIGLGSACGVHILERSAA